MKLDFVRRAQLERRILKLAETRLSGAAIRDALVRDGYTAAEVRSALEGLVRRGDLERINPPRPGDDA